MVRGDVHEIHLRQDRGHTQHGRRFAVIVQADDLMALSTIAICPTSQSAPAATFHPEVRIDGEPTRVLCEMVRAIDGRGLGKPVGHLSLDEVKAVDYALSLVLNLA